MIFYEQVIPNVIKSHEWTSWAFFRSYFFVSYSESKNKSLFWAIKYFFVGANNAPENDLFFSDKKSTSPVPVWLTSALAETQRETKTQKYFFFDRKLFKVIPTAAKLICSNLFSRLRSHGQCSVVSFRLVGDRRRKRRVMRERLKNSERERERIT